MEGQLNGNIGENSSSSSCSSSLYPAQDNSSNSTSSLQKPYKPKFHNYINKKLAAEQEVAAVPMAGILTLAPLTPGTPNSFFSNNSAHPLVSFVSFAAAIKDFVMTVYFFVDFAFTGAAHLEDHLRE